jgi:hypothetical protein
MPHHRINPLRLNRSDYPYTPIFQRRSQTNGPQLKPEPPLSNLIVDDEASIRRMLTVAFIKAGYEALAGPDRPNPTPTTEGGYGTGRRPDGSKPDSEDEPPTLKRRAL